jgi:hypothetical protein
VATPQITFGRSVETFEPPDAVTIDTLYCWDSVGAAALVNKMWLSELRPLGHGKRSRSLTTGLATDFMYLFLVRTGVQLAHRQPPGLADRLCFLHTGIHLYSQLQLAHR